MSKESPAEPIAQGRCIDDLVQVMQDQDADPRAVAQCLQHLAELLEKLGGPGAGLLVQKSLDRNRLAGSKRRTDR